MLEDGHVREVYILCFVVLLLFCFVFLYCQAQTPAELSYISTSAPHLLTPRESLQGSRQALAG